jgi:DNA-binding NarL/FixJ family response regulator
MSEVGPVRVGIVEGYSLVRQAFRSLLESGGAISVVGDAAGGADVLTMLETHRPEVVLLIMSGNSEREFALLRDLPAIAEYAHALVVTPHLDTALHAEAIELGARGVVLADQPAHTLVKAVLKVSAGEIWLDRAHTAGVVRRLTRRRPDEDPESAKIDSLTPREKEIVALVTEGLNNKDIAQRLFISEATARNHLTSILDKLDLADRFQLTVYAFRRGLVLCPQTPAMLRVAAAMSSSQQRQRNVATGPRVKGPPGLTGPAQKR